MLNWKILTLSVASFSTVNFVACVAYGLAVPRAFHAAWLLEGVLPGFTWLTPGSFFLGLLETFVYGAYAGALFTGVYNSVARRLRPAAPLALRRERAA